MDKNTRFRINLSIRELEVEGTEEFVREYAGRFEKVISLFASAQTFGPTTSTLSVTDKSKSQDQTAQQDIPEIFGEYFQKYRKEISDVDKVLVAAYYTQMQDEKNEFSTATANKHLKSMGIKVANASVAVKSHINSKRIFPTIKGKYRVSIEGIDYLNGLLVS